MPAVALITVGTLNENARITETLGEHLTANIIQSNALANVSTRLFHHLVAIHIWEQAETKALRIGGIGEAIDSDWGLRCMEGLTDAQIKLVVTNGTPESWILIHDWSGIEGLCWWQVWEI